MAAELSAGTVGTRCSWQWAPLTLPSSLQTARRARGSGSVEAGQGDATEGRGAGEVVARRARNRAQLIFY